MKRLLFGLMALPFLAGVALAAEPLSDMQMDRIIAGDLLSDTLALVCPACKIPTTPDGITLPTNGGTTNGKLNAILGDVISQLITQGFPQSP